VPLTPTRVLDGRALAEAGIRELAGRVETLRRGGAAAPALLALASAADPSAPHTLNLKGQAAQRAGVGFRAQLLGRDDSLEALLGEAADDPSIHGIFVQWPTAPIPAPPFPGPLHPLLDAIPLEKDVDASSPRSRQAMEVGRPVHCPAEALAVVEALVALGVTPSGTPIRVVGGDDATTLGILATLRLQGARPERIAAGDSSLREALSRAEVVVTAQAPAGGIPGAWLRPGAVLVDAGYTVPGGIGHVALGPGTPPLRARVPPRGGIGPLTVLALLGNTVRAAALAQPSLTPPPASR
jgi:methylenetetrahydrofolate dehydrogenase (NADP+) / methenyltetrahydrofolate cyclohydrolase